MVAVVLGGFWRLWIGDLFDESGADALRLVKILATRWTAVTGDRNFSVWFRCLSGGGIVPRFSSGRSTVSPDIVFGIVTALIFVIFVVFIIL